MQIIQDQDVTFMCFPYDQGELSDPYEILDYLKSKKNKKIIIFDPEEFIPCFQPPDPKTHSEYVERFNHIVKQNQLHIECWVCIHSAGSLEEYRQFDVHIVNWQSYLLHLTGFDLLKHYPNYKQDILSEKNFTKLAISTMSKPANHRCMLIESIFKNRLNSDFFLSWLMPEHAHFEFAHFSNNKLILDYDPGTNTNPSEIYPPCLLIPPEFYQGLFNVVSETSVHHMDISEKTFTPMLCKKPFLILGAPGIHQKLETYYGLKLFHDHIDYEFDSEWDTQKRIDMIIEQLQRHAGSDYNTLYEQMLPVIEHNYQRCWQIIQYRELYPEGIDDLIPFLIELDHWLSKTII